MSGWSWWLTGFVVALGGGHLAVWWLLRYLRGKGFAPPEKKTAGFGAPEKKASEPHAFALGVPAWLTGTLERFFFMLVVAASLSGAVVAMIAWLAAKMGANWSSEAGEAQVPEGWNPASVRMSALLAGLVSMLFAFLGALIAKRGQLAGPMF